MVDSSVAEIKFVTVTVLWGQARTHLLGDAYRRLLENVFGKYIRNSTRGEHPIQENACQIQQAEPAGNPSGAEQMALLWVPPLSFLLQEAPTRLETRSTTVT